MGVDPGAGTTVNSVAAGSDDGKIRVSEDYPHPGKSSIYSNFKIYLFYYIPFLSFFLSPF